MSKIYWTYYYTEEYNERGKETIPDHRCDWDTNKEPHIREVSSIEGIPIWNMPKGMEIIYYEA